jgi:chemosensory pili system protein ChpA (sensor histidine kinase/response regulator)
VRSWQEQPGNAASPQALLRLLHTLKGSARMAGAMQLGQHFHELETRIENLMRLGQPSPQATEDLLIRYDHGLYLFELLQNPEAAKAAAAVPAKEAQPEGEQPAQPAAVPAHSGTTEPMVPAPLVPMHTGSVVASKAPLAKPAAVPAAPVPLVRVRADILDRMVNQAGEVSISRSRLETEVGTLRQSLSELTENVMRLRDQLREIEMQAETQITSRMAHSADREFDPLEFDRFTRLQELTRMMAESVNDVGSVQQNLSRTLDNATGDLTIQARLTRDLQQDLMRVRMIQFASISERLYRVTRQAAKELDKRVNLDIRGSAVEIDRGVLEKMTGPFEHLLRNAVVHGIESREARRAAGKDETGELLVEIRQEGNEVVIRFADDGQGLNLDGIRKKAMSTGLLTDGSALSDDEVRDLIFHPGFSTADAVTELAGRGVGMDVVRSEAAALGGRVSTWSEPGKGAQFTIHLPLTLAVTQVALLVSGGKTYAVPSVLVEQVQQLKSNPLAAAYNDGAVVWQGQRVPLYYLPALLGDSNASPVAQQYSPLMILKSGSDRVAIHIDEVIGNREVVVKNIGPQLARMIGVAGATVLGSGEIVLILNPVPLAQRAAHEHVRAPRLIPSSAPESMGAVAEMAGSQPATPTSGPVQGLRTQSIVMVVDDSLTVRRVTQRLLSREGYQVVLAKDGVDALEHLQSVSPDVMLVDIEMPRMDGFDLTRNVRGDERTRHIPIIMITSRTAEKHRNYALELGVNQYLGKPYQEEQLLRLVAGFIKKDVPIA